MTGASNERLAPLSLGPQRRIREWDSVVSRVIQETPDTVTLVLFTGQEPLDYLPGHFLTVDPHQFPVLEGLIAYLERQKGKREPPRAYSMSSAPYEEALAITIKEERYRPGETLYPPLLSPLLVHGVREGDHLGISGFTGPYTLPERIESLTDHLVHVVAGSGVVPNYAILKHALHSGMNLRHTFIYSNKTWADVCFRESLEQLEHRHPERLRVVHTLTREENPQRWGPNVRAGRVSAELLAELIPSPAECMVFTCGPAIGPWERLAAKQRGEAPAPRFLETVLAHLMRLGVPASRIRRESYG